MKEASAERQEQNAEVKIPPKKRIQKKPLKKTSRDEDQNAQETLLVPRTAPPRNSSAYFSATVNLQLGG